MPLSQHRSRYRRPGNLEIVGEGHNGPPAGIPSNDDADYLKNVFYPQLSDSEKEKVGDVERHAGCGECPRKLIGAPSGKRLELCTCIHGETEAIVNATRNIRGCYMFCYCGVPCIECSKLIAAAGIAEVYCMERTADYSAGSRWLLSKAGVKITILSEEFLSGKNDIINIIN